MNDVRVKRDDLESVLAWVATKRANGEAMGDVTLGSYRSLQQALSGEKAEQDDVATGFAKMASAFMCELAMEMQRLTGSTPDDDPFELRGEVLRYLRSLPATTHPEAQAVAWRCARGSDCRWKGTTLDARGFSESDPHERRQWFDKHSRRCNAEIRALYLHPANDEAQAVATGLMTVKQADAVLSPYLCNLKGNLPGEVKLAITTLQDALQPRGEACWVILDKDESLPLEARFMGAERCKHDAHAKINELLGAGLDDYKNAVVRPVYLHPAPDEAVRLRDLVSAIRSELECGSPVKNVIAWIDGQLANQQKGNG